MGQTLKVGSVIRNPLATVDSAEKLDSAAEKFFIIGTALNRLMTALIKFFKLILPFKIKLKAIEFFAQPP